MIQQSIASEWLNDIDGMTIKQAINYLSQLDDSLILSYSLDDNLFSRGVECCLIHEREETKEELAQQREKHKQAKIARINKDIDSLLKGIESGERYIKSEIWGSNNKPLPIAKQEEYKRQERIRIDCYSVRIDKLREELKNYQ